MNSNLQESTIIIPNKWYDDLNISNEELTVLILLYRFRAAEICCFFFTSIQK